MLTFETFLPVFPGLYCTGWDLNDDNPDWLYDVCNDPNVFTSEQQDKWGDLFWSNYDYSKYKADIKDVVVETVQDYFQDELGLPSFNIENPVMRSPQFYNFSNDSIDCTITISEDDWAKVVNTLTEWSGFAQYIADKYTSRDGFMSHYSNDPKQWEQIANDPSQLQSNGHYAGSLLDAYVEAMTDIEKIDHLREITDDYYENFHQSISLGEYWEPRLGRIFDYLVQRAERKTKKKLVDTF